LLLDKIDIGNQNARATAFGDATFSDVPVAPPSLFVLAGSAPGVINGIVSDVPGCVYICMYVCASYSHALYSANYIVDCCRRNKMVCLGSSFSWCSIVGHCSKVSRFILARVSTKL
jgi:hypothetical protein